MSELHEIADQRLAEQPLVLAGHARRLGLDDDLFLLGHREIVVKDPDGYVLRFYHTIEGEITEYNSNKYQHNNDIQPSLLFKEWQEKDDRQMRLPLGNE